MATKQSSEGRALWAGGHQANTLNMNMRLSYSRSEPRPTEPEWSEWSRMEHER